ncbi:MAG: hypothetical protein FJX29_00960, partial [Alphaproteobacteria bacterium]|nr:hypothetical protein [Alphaproteobacteria bacterium]
MALAAALAVAAGISLSAAGAVAQNAPASKPAAKPANPVQEKIDKRLFELRGVEDTIRASAEQRRKIEAELELVRHDRVRLNTALIDTTAAIRKVEERIAGLERNLAAQEQQEQALQKSLDARRAVMVEILAALQRIGRHPPPALIVSSDDVLKAVRASMMMGAVLPQLREEARVLVADLEELAAVRKTIASERARLGVEIKTLAGERVRLASLVEERQKTMENVRSALASERQRAGELAKQAATLKDLIARMEGEITGARRAAEAARAAERQRQETAALRPGLDPSKPASPFADRARLTPAIAFAEAKGLLPLPVSGRITRGFGEKDAFGGDEKGLSIVSGPGSVVASPSDGWVA